ncbi:hypothetical protein B0I35DRAFT_476921 [Stachybotrys elegans]|uniref:Apple domain-containing protein n=1 Tax=Stachybotrys elegans TaxID=80388 RepID=A0A8K0WT32_9HYPO|nr:hypothetical protein B0I35DRAFT_476921 [Stachybotrys elegans]
MDPFDNASVIASTTGSGVAHGTGSRTTSGTTGLSLATPSPSSFPHPPLQLPEPVAAATTTTKNPTSPTTAAAAAASKPGAHKPSRIVSWSDRGRRRTAAAAADQQEKYTFYRDPTPPPPPTFEQPSLKGAPLIADDAYDYRYDHVAPPAPLPVARVCGLPRRVFLMLLAAIVLVVVLAVGIGVGVGVGVNGDSEDGPDRQDNAESNLSIPPSSTNPPSSTESSSVSTSSPSSTRPSTELPTTVTSNPAITTLVACPAANGTTFDVPGSDARFLRLCGVDYTGPRGAVDLANVWTPTMEDCMIQCAGYTGCEACSWGVIEDDPGSYHRCWMKKNIRASSDVRDGWAFGILLED